MIVLSVVHNDEKSLGNEHLILQLLCSVPLYLPAKCKMAVIFNFTIRSHTEKDFIFRRITCKYDRY